MIEFVSPQVEILWLLDNTNLFVHPSIRKINFGIKIRHGVVEGVESLYTISEKGEEVSRKKRKTLNIGKLHYGMF